VTSLGHRRRGAAIVGTVAGTGLGATLVLALLAGALAFAATVVPRERAQAQSSALRTELAEGGPGTSSLFGSSDLGSLRQSLHQADPDGMISINQIAEPEKALSTELASLGVPLSTAAADYWQGLNTIQYDIGFTNATPAQVALPRVQTALNYRTDLTDHAVLVHGAMPDRATSPAGGHRPGFFQVAVTEQTATTFHLNVGATLTLAAAAATPITLRVTGILKARDPADEFWGYDPLAFAPELRQPTNGAVYWQSGLFVGEGEVGALEEAFSGQAMPLEYSLPLDLSGLTSGQAQPLANAMVTATSYATTALSVDLSGGPAQTLNQFLSQR
jgi:hypothetical protein